MTAVSRSVIAILFVALAIAWFGTLSARRLAKTDEGRYAEIPREMVATGNWLTPRLNGIKYFEKPALQYWGTATAFSLFGLHDWTARLWTGLTGFAGIILVGLTAARIYGPATGVTSGAVLASSLYYALMGHINTLDMGLAFFMSAGLCCALLARLDATPDKARWWACGLWAALALAVLSKGLVGLVLPGAVAFIYLAWTRDWTMLRRLLPWQGPVLFAFLAMPWFVSVSIANPEFAHFFFIHEHFDRYLTTTHHRAGPWWYFIPIVMLGVLPWLSVSVLAVWHATDAPGCRLGKPAIQASVFYPDRLLVVWVLFIFIFFSISSSKLPSYILPIFPALAILTARELMRASHRALAVHCAVATAVGLLALALAANTTRFAPTGDLEHDYRQFGGYLVVAALVWIGGGAAATLRANASGRLQAVLLLASAGVAAALIALTGFSSLDHAASAEYVAAVVAPLVENDTRIYSVDMYEQTLPYYLRHTMILVNHRDELDMGLTSEPDKWIPTHEDFSKQWLRDAHAIAIMPPESLKAFQAMNLPMRVILSDRRFVVVAKP